MIRPELKEMIDDPELLNMIDEAETVQKDPDKVIPVNLSDEKREEVQRLVTAVHKKLIQKIYIDYGLWLAVDAMVKLYSFYDTAKILQVSGGYLYQVTSSKQVPSQKITLRAKAGLEEWLSEEEE